MLHLICNSVLYNNYSLDYRHFQQGQFEATAAIDTADNAHKTSNSFIKMAR